MKKRILIISIVIVLIILTVLALYFIANKTYQKERNLRLFNESYVAKSLTEAQNLDPQKPMLVLFYGNYCATCHQFMPIFNQLAKDYKDKYNFLTLDIQNPVNYPLVNGNVGSIPTLVIFDTMIGNKVHISIQAARNYNQLRAELDRYLKIRSYIDLEKAKSDHEKFLSEQLKAAQKEN